MTSLFQKRLLLTIHATLPAAQPSIWFLTITDDREVTTSSRLMIANEAAK